MFRYGDGTTSGLSSLVNNSNWQTFSITSAVGKTVVAIELGWYNGEYLHLGNVLLKTQYMGRADGRLAGETIQNGNYEKYTFDALGRLENSSITADKTSSTEYLKETYTYIDRGTKNLLNIRNRTASASGITITCSNGIVTISGTATADVSVFVYLDAVVMPGTYRFSLFNDKVFTGSDYLRFNDGQSPATYSPTVRLTSLNYSVVPYEIAFQTTTLGFRFYSGTVTNYTMKPMLEYANGNGDNVLDILNGTSSGSGLTINSSNGVISFSGTANADVSLYAYLNTPIDSGTYKLIANNDKALLGTDFFRLRNASNSYFTSDMRLKWVNYSCVINVAQECTILAFRFISGTETNFTMSPQLEYYVDSAPLYEAYIPSSSGDTSTVISSMTVSRGSTNIVSYNYTYNMDASGIRNFSIANPYNIYQLKEGSTLKAEYYYDALGRLERENNADTNQTVAYTYDANNNILSKTAYSLAWGNNTLTGGTVKNYTYTDTTYKDRLTNHNGNIIYYNSLGNPLVYLGKDLGWTGRELTTYYNDVKNLIYKYDDKGLRLSKGQTKYLYNGSLLIRESNATDTIWYLYDQNGMIGFQLNGTTYYYVRNLQGDVMRIINTSGTVYATYTYDAWGKCTVGTNTSGIAEKTPFVTVDIFMT